ncbi:MAG: DUF983 domain-containing protein [Bacteroidota bacterium]|nr:DUF983 domain-containing protein [Bacteroidota bacterium]
MDSTNTKHRYLWSILNLKCPHCREGKIFQNKSSFNAKDLLKMNDPCPICGQRMEIKKEFYYGTTYISYGVSIAFSVFTFFVWLIFIGFSVDDNRIFWWLGINGILVLLLQPYIMRLSRAIFLSFSIDYDANWKSIKPGSVDPALNME